MEIINILMSIPFQQILSQPQISFDIQFYKEKQPSNLVTYISTIISLIIKSSSPNEDIIKGLYLELNDANVSIQIILSSIKTLKDTTDIDDVRPLSSTFMSLLIKCINSITIDINPQHNHTKIQRNLLIELLDSFIRSGNVSLLTLTLIRDIVWSRSLIGNLEDLTKKTIITMLFEMIDYTFINCKRQFPSILYQSALLFKELSSLLIGKEDIITEFYEEIFKLQSSINDFILLIDCLSLLGLAIWNNQSLRCSFEKYILSKNVHLERSTVLFLLKGNSTCAFGDDSYTILAKYLEIIIEIDENLKNNPLKSSIKAKTSLKEEILKIDLIVEEIFSHNFQCEYDFQSLFKVLPKPFNEIILKHDGYHLLMINNSRSPYNIIDSIEDFDILFEYFIKNYTKILRGEDFVWNEERMRKIVISILNRKITTNIPEELFYFALSYLNYFGSSREMLNLIRKTSNGGGGGGGVDTIAPQFFKNFVLNEHQIDSINFLLSSSYPSLYDIPSIISLIIESSSYDKEFILSMNKLSKILCSPIKWAIKGENNEFINSLYEISLQWCFLSSELNDTSIRINSCLLLHKGRMDTFEDIDGITITKNDSLWRTRDVVSFIFLLIKHQKIEDQTCSISLCEILLYQEWLDLPLYSPIDDLVDILYLIVKDDSFFSISHLIIVKLDLYCQRSSPPLQLSPFKSLFSILERYIVEFEEGGLEDSNTLKDLKILLSIELFFLANMTPIPSYVPLYKKWRSSSSTLEVTCNTMIFELCLLGNGNDEWYQDCIHDFSIINGKLECEGGGEGGDGGEDEVLLLSNIRYKAISIKSIQSLITILMKILKKRILSLTEDVLNFLVKKRREFVTFDSGILIESCSYKFLEIGKMISPFLKISFSILPLSIYHLFLQQTMSFIKGVIILIDISIKLSSYGDGLITLLGSFITGSFIRDIYLHLPLAQQSFQEEFRSKNTFKKAKINTNWISKMVPNLVFIIEKCEKNIILLYGKLDLLGKYDLRDELVSFMKISISRDFRIQIDDLPPTQYPSRIRNPIDNGNDSLHNDDVLNSSPSASSSSSSICPSDSENENDNNISSSMEQCTELTLDL